MRRPDFERFPELTSQMVADFAPQHKDRQSRLRLTVLLDALGCRIRDHCTKGNYLIRGLADDFYYSPKSTKIRFVGSRTRGVNHNSKNKLSFITGDAENALEYFIETGEYLRWSDKLKAPLGFSETDTVVIQDFYRKAETEKAILLGQGKNEGWFPHSQIRFDDVADGFIVPAWLAIAKEFNAKLFIEGNQV